MGNCLGELKYYYNGPRALSDDWEMHFGEADRVLEHPWW